MTTGTLTRRPTTAADTPFLRDVYASTRADELAPLPWTEADKQQFLSMQFDAQDRAYRANYPDADFDIVELDARPVGRIVVARLGDDELRIADVALLAAFRNRGLGTTLIRAVVAEARESGRFVSLHVEHWNPAVALYERLGFRRASENDVHIRMEFS